MITLAVVTGVSPQDWVDAGARGIATAFEVLEEMHKPKGDQGDQDGSGSDGPQYSG